MSLSEQERIEAAAKAMYDAVLAGAGSADDFNNRPPEVKEIWIQAARAAAPHLGDGKLRKAAQRLKEEFTELEYYGKFVKKIVMPDESWPYVQVGTGAWLMLKARIAGVIAALSPQEPQCPHGFRADAYCVHCGGSSTGAMNAAQPPAPDEGDVVERMQIKEFFKSFGLTLEDEVLVAIQEWRGKAREGYVALEELWKELRF